MKSHQIGSHETEEPDWLSIFLETKKVLLSGKEVSLDPNPDDVRSDVTCLIEYFENFNNGFHGDVLQHQRDYFMFMAWFYFSPFICDLRNHAHVAGEFIFDFPMFAILFGKSNAGKSEIIKTLMQSMFGQYYAVPKDGFTGGNLRALLTMRKRFPVVFNDLERDRFTRHGADVIKDEEFTYEEYPAFVLSMNAENQSFSTEIMKRCLMLYTGASLPENTPASRDLYRSLSAIRRRMSTALYQKYLSVVLNRFETDGLPTDMLRFSSEVLKSIFDEYYDGELPPWCIVVNTVDYQAKKYERVKDELRKLYDTNRSIWEVRRDEVLIRGPQTEINALRRDIPAWILKLGSKAGQLVLDKDPLEDFLEMSFKRKRRFIFI